MSPSQSYDFKLLEHGEVAEMRDLLRVFSEAFEDAPTYGERPPSDAYLNRVLEMEHFIALVALHDGRVVGGLTAYVLDKFEQERREAYIYDLAVLKEHRRVGVATGLIQELKRIASQRGVYVIFVQADQGDEPAIRLYESLGKRQDVHHFDIPVS